jgi:hypothetical protein
MAKYNQQTLEKRREYNRRWRDSHPDYGKQKYASLTLEQKAEKLAYQRETYRTIHGDKRRATAKKSRLKVKFEVIDAYGGKCQCCGESRIEFLSIDHIHGSGRKEIMALNIGRGFQYYGYLRRNKFPDKDRLRVLCMNCNFAMGIIGYCPHQRPRFVVDVETSGVPLSVMSGSALSVN